MASPENVNRLTNPKVWEFDRHLNGRRMAEGVRIERAGTFEEACRSAVALASPGSVLVVRQSDELTQLRGNLSLAEEGLANYALEVERLKSDRDHWEKMARTPADGDPLVAARAKIERLQTLLIRVLEDGEPSQDLLQEIDEAVTRPSSEPEQPK